MPVDGIALAPFFFNTVRPSAFFPTDCRGELRLRTLPGRALERGPGSEVPDCARREARARVHVLAVEAEDEAASNGRDRSPDSSARARDDDDPHVLAGLEARSAKRGGRAVVDEPQAGPMDGCSGLAGDGSRVDHGRDDENGPHAHQYADPVPAGRRTRSFPAETGSSTRFA
jgi:hypothetical protein